MNQRRWDGSLGSDKGWMEKVRLQVSAECWESFARTTLDGRLFQIAGAAKRKPWAPYEMLQQVTDRRYRLRQTAVEQLPYDDFYCQLLVFDVCFCFICCRLCMDVFKYAGKKRITSLWSADWACLYDQSVSSCLCYFGLSKPSRYRQ